jgi:hypothetical protein
MKQRLKIFTYYFTNELIMSSILTIILFLGLVVCDLFSIFTIMWGLLKICIAFICFNLIITLFNVNIILIVRQITNWDKISLFISLVTNIIIYIIFFYITFPMTSERINSIILHILYISSIILKFYHNKHIYLNTNKNKLKLIRKSFQQKLWFFKFNSYIIGSLISILYFIGKILFLIYDNSYTDADFIVRDFLEIEINLF